MPSLHRNLSHTSARVQWSIRRASPLLRRAPLPSHLLYVANFKASPSHILFTLLVLIAISTATPSSEPLHVDSVKDSPHELPSPKTPEPSYLRHGGFRASKPRQLMTCDKYPSLCRAKGSAGPDCCNKQCVDVMTDKLNCGKCGKMCKYSEICCQGKCVNPSMDEEHCGKCNHNCKAGSSCVYGLCSYA